VLAITVSGIAVTAFIITIIKHQQQSMYFEIIAIHDGLYHASFV